MRESIRRSKDMLGVLEVRLGQDMQEMRNSLRGELYDAYKREVSEELEVVRSVQKTVKDIYRKVNQ